MQYWLTFQTDLKTNFAHQLLQNLNIVKPKIKVLSHGCRKHACKLNQKLKFFPMVVVNMHVSTQDDERKGKQLWEWQRHKLDF